MHKLDFNIDPDCLKFARSKHKKHQTYGQQDRTSLWTQIKQYGTSTVMFSASDSFSL